MDKNLPQLLKRISKENPSVKAQYFKNGNGEFESLTFAEMFETVKNFAAGLTDIGCKRGDRIGLISDNRKEWQHVSMGIMSIGATDVPRGCDATERDVVQILSIVEASTVIVENGSQVKKLLKNLEQLPLITTVIVIDDDFPTEKVEFEKILGYRNGQLLTYATILERGIAFLKAQPDFIDQEIEKTQPDDLATIIFTSGTTGVPKGVMLAHENFLCQLEDLLHRIRLGKGERAISVLPVWHSFERACEYVIIYAGSGIVYSKPIGSVLLADFAKMNPQLMPSVPRIWESVHDGIFKALRKQGGIAFALFSFFLKVGNARSHYHRRLFKHSAYLTRQDEILAPFIAFIPWLVLTPLHLLGDVLVFKKIRKKLGTGFSAGVSGGGALPPNIDEFFWTVGINVVEGYGLTETAPVVAVRFTNHPIFGTIGTACAYNEVKIVDEKGNELPVGQKGTVMIRGKNVMKGYYKQPKLTEQVIDKDGWFDSGDIGYKCLNGEIVLRGRKKDTIVLRGGENIEPVPIEMQLQESRYIKTAVVVGQDKRSLGVLIVPDDGELKQWAKEQNILKISIEELLETPEVKKMFEKEVSSLICADNGFKLFERISKIKLLAKPFEIGVELSAKQEVMRYKVSELYAQEINILFDE